MRIDQNNLEDRKDEVLNRRIYISLTKEGRRFLRRLREEKSISQNLIMYNTEIDQSSISDWELGRYDPILENLKIYLKFLNVNINQFLNNKRLIKKIKPKFESLDMPQKREIKTHQSIDPHIILTERGRNVIRRYRIKKGSQNAVAMVSRIDQSSISNWENGKINPTLKRFKNYLETIDLSSEKFLSNKSYIKEIKESIMKRMINKSADSRRKKILPQNFISPKKAYLMGVVGPGDGYLGRDEIEFTATDKDFTNEFSNCIEKVYGYRCKIKRIQPKFINHKVKFRVRLNSKAACDDLRRYNVSYKEKKWRVPVEIKRTSNKIKAFYLKGIFDSQANVNILKKQIRIIMLNLIGLYELKSLLDDLDIKSNISEKFFGLTIYGKENFKRYAKYINFSIKRKRKALGKLIE